MIRSKRAEILAAFVLDGAVHRHLWRAVRLSDDPDVSARVTNAPLIGPGDWVGFDNFRRLASERLFSVAVWNTIYFVILSVVPITLMSLLVALGVNRLKGWTAERRAGFLLPSLHPARLCRLPVWQWILDKDFGIAQYVLAPLAGGQRVSVFGTVASFMPAVALR